MRKLVVLGGKRTVKKQSNRNDYAELRTSNIFFEKEYI